MINLSKILFLTAFVLMSSIVSAQKYDTIQVKENFDAYNDYVVYKRHKVCTIDPNHDAFNFGDGMSKILEGYLDLYDATGDKAYLYKFVMQSLCIVENRNDINPAADANTPKWTEADASTYTDGYILASFARFIYYIRILYPELNSEQLYQFPELNSENYEASTCFCNYTGEEFVTFGNYTTWLSSRVNETFDYFFEKGAWTDEFGMQQTTGGLIVNMQTGFARALLFMGLADNNSEYFRKAKLIANLHKSTVSFNDKCNKVEYSQPVLHLNTEKNSYWWYHMGWRVSYRKCKGRLKQMPDYDYFVSYVEDINHGAIVTLFPYDYYKYASDTIFTEFDMIRFKNTFTKNIYDGEKYNMGVDGSNGTTYNDKVYDSLTLQNTLKYSSLVYSRWAEFDDLEHSRENPQVYELTMSDYIKYYDNHTTFQSWYSGQKSLGHAMLVKEQWSRDSVDLSIYNRDVVYNQDFYVPGNLIIDAKNPKRIPSSDKMPYAEPKEFLDKGETDRFVIEPDVEVNLSAGKSVRLKQGFHAKKGSKLRISLIGKE
jgi:hypothetical protein